MASASASPAKKVSGADSILRSSDFDVEGFRRRLIEAAPRFVALNGKKAAATFLGRSTGQVPIGILPIRIGTVEVFVLPSTSGAARYRSIEPWFALARLTGSAPASAR